MAFDDVHLERPPAPRRVPARSATSRWVILGAGTIIAGALLALWWLGHAQSPPAALPPTTATESVRPPTRPLPQPMQLPPLVESDSMLRELFAALSNNPVLARLLAQRGIVRAATLAVVQIGDGKTPAVPLMLLRPAERVSILGGAVGRVDPDSYGRWDSAVRALHSIDAPDAAKLYVTLKPLFDQAYRELGYPNGDFDDAIVKAIRMLNQTPDLPSDPVLLKRPAYLEHEDPALRELAPVQKQLLLTGAEHRREILSWLRTFATTLELKID
jgi:hypothetical protein